MLTLSIKIDEKEFEDMVTKLVASRIADCDRIGETELAYILQGWLERHVEAVIEDVSHYVRNDDFDWFREEVSDLDSYWQEEDRKTEEAVMNGEWYSLNPELVTL